MGWDTQRAGCPNHVRGHRQQRHRDAGQPLAQPALTKVDKGHFTRPGAHGSRLCLGLPAARHEPTAGPGDGEAAPTALPPTAPSWEASGSGDPGWFGRAQPQSDWLWCAFSRRRGGAQAKVLIAKSCFPVSGCIVVDCRKHGVGGVTASEGRMVLSAPKELSPTP